MNVPSSHKTYELICRPQGLVFTCRRWSVWGSDTFCQIIDISWLEFIPVVTATVCDKSAKIYTRTLTDGHLPLTFKSVSFNLTRVFATAFYYPTYNGWGFCVPTSAGMQPSPFAGKVTGYEVSVFGPWSALQPLATYVSNRVWIWSGDR